MAKMVPSNFFLLSLLPLSWSWSWSLGKTRLSWIFSVLWAPAVLLCCVRLFEKGCNPGSIISRFKAQAGVCGPKVNWVHQQSKPDFPVSLESIAHLNALSCQMLLSVGWYYSSPRFEENCGSAKATCSWFSWDENPRLTKDFRPSGFRDVKQLAPGHLENLGFIFP